MKIMRKCKQCNKLKTIKEFPLRKDANLYRLICNECFKLNHRNYYHKNKHIYKKYRKKNKKKLDSKTRKYYNENKEKILKQKQEYHLKNKKHILKYRKKYYINNKKQIIENLNKYCKNKRKHDLRFKITHNLRTRLSHIVNGENKSASTMQLLGCCVDYLMYHLQEQFTKGMTWDNYGFYGWHIDHIKPCASFDLSKPEEQRKCFHFSNMQPLWAEDNLSKGGKYEG